MKFLLIQFVGAIAYAILSLSYFRKQKDKILLMEIFAYAIFAVHYYLLNGVTGAICNLIGMFALLTIFLFDKYKIDDRKISALLFVIALLIVNIITYQNIFSIFPLVASSIVIISFLTNNENYIRAVGLISALCWLIYAVVYKSYISILFEAITLIFTFIAYIKNKIVLNKK